MLFFHLFFLLTGSVKSQEGWFTLLTQNDTSALYTGLKFVNSNTGFITSSWGNYQNNGGYTLKSTNGGINWFTVESGVSRFGLFFLNEQTGWTYGGYWETTSRKSREVFRTINGGANFTRVFIDSLTTGFKGMFFTDANTGWILTTQNIIKTTNSGYNWSVCAPLYLNSIYFVNANTGWGLTSSGLIYYTTNGGTAWASQLTVSGNAFTRLTFINQNTGWVCGAPPNIYKTTNAGVTWNPYSCGLTVLMGSIEFADALNGWVASNGGNISHTSNGGINWTLQTTVADMVLTDLTFPNQYTGYVLGTHINSPNFSYDNKLLKTTTGGTVFVQKIGNEVPESFSLSQNYPNPFNPKSNIKFQIAKSGLVKVAVYDVLGRDVTALVNEELQPGTYEVEWDGTNYPSGVYFYKLSSGDYIETRKMVLIK